MLLHTIGLLLQAAFRSSMYHQFSFFNNAHLGPYCPLHVEYIWIKIPQKMWSKDWKNDLAWAKKNWAYKGFQFEMKIWNYQNYGWIFFLTFSILPLNQECFWGHWIQPDSKITIYYVLFGNMYSKSAIKLYKSLE